MKKLYTHPNQLYQAQYVILVPPPDDPEPREQSFKIGAFSITHITTPRAFDRWGRVKRESYRLEIKTKNRSWTYKRGE